MSTSKPNPSYTVFIRLPFPRGDFEDPPHVEWDAAKDKALWKVLSKASKNSDIDWAELATKFEVTLSFLLQQAAWLYERQLLQVRAQMRKVGVSKGSLTPSPVPGSTSETTGGETMRRAGSGGGGPRATSAMSSRKESPAVKGDGSISSITARTPALQYSRAPSATTTAQVKNTVPSASSKAASGTATSRRSLSPKPRSRPPSIAIPAQVQRSPQAETLASPVMSSSSSDTSSSDSAPVQSRLLRRPARFPPTKKLGQSGDADLDDDEEEDDEPAFMPFAADATKDHSTSDPSATLRGDPRTASRRLQSYTHPQSHVHRTKSSNLAPEYKSQTSDSSSSSAPQTIPHAPQRPTGPLSPRRTMELAGRSSAAKGKGREGSEGSPSMGSSFSDLEDASVTQSALEEALASNMQAGGGMASRMSSISQALRSRYL